VKFLVIQHLAIEPAALIGECIEEAGHTLHAVMADEGDSLPESLRGYSGVVVMGGPMSANDTHLEYIAGELALLKQTIEADIPVLGICLGAQLLARAAGAGIMPSPVRELGWYRLLPVAAAADDPLFASLPASGMDVFQWHGETLSLPEGATLLASCTNVPHQAFRIGSSQYGLQFHIEVDEPAIEVWIEAGESERGALGSEGIEAIRRESPLRLPEAHRFCRQMVAAWLKLAERG